MSRSKETQTKRKQKQQFRVGFLIESISIKVVFFIYFKYILKDCLSNGSVRLIFIIESATISHEPISQRILLAALR